MAGPVRVWHSTPVDGDHDLVFEWALTRISPSGARDPIRVRVAAPVYLDEPAPCWRCVFTVEGHSDREFPIFGATALQALSLALKILREVLRGISSEATLVEAGTGEILNDQTLAEAIY